MTASDATVWLVIVLLGAGTYLIRFSFLGLVGDRSLPTWLLRALRFTPVAVMPGLVAPLVLWPQATGGAPDPARIAAAVATVLVGVATRNVVASVLAGMATLHLGLWLIA